MVKRGKRFRISHLVPLDKRAGIVHTKSTGPGCAQNDNQSKLIGATNNEAQ